MCRVKLDGERLQELEVCGDCNPSGRDRVLDIARSSLPPGVEMEDR